MPTPPSSRQPSHADLEQVRKHVLSEVDEKIDGLKEGIEAHIAFVVQRTIGDRLESLTRVNADQMKLLMEAAEERARRRKAEDDAEDARLMARANADAAKFAADAHTSKRNTLVTVIGSIAVALITLIGSAILSHCH